jgi:hypothetical protein
MLADLSGAGSSANSTQASPTDRLRFVLDQLTSGRIPAVPLINRRAPGLLITSIRSPEVTKTWAEAKIGCMIVSEWGWKIEGARKGGFESGDNCGILIECAR